LRLLSAIASGCDVATRQLFEDPSNFYILDLASAGSDSLGISPVAQVCVCFFLGNCFAALEDPPEKEGSSTLDSVRLTRKSFLNVIETRIGLPRFSDLLKRPITSGKRGQTKDTMKNLFFSSGFETFYRAQVESIRSRIYTFYAGDGDGADSGSDSSLRMIVDIQKEKILELERVLAANNIRIDVIGPTAADSDSEAEGRSREKGRDGNRGEKIVPGNEGDMESTPGLPDSTAQLARIKELESSLLESDSEVLALQQLLVEKENEKQKEIQLLLTHNLGNSGTLDLNQIYPESEMQTFGAVNPLGGDNPGPGPTVSGLISFDLPTFECVFLPVCYHFIHPTHKTNTYALTAIHPYKHLYPHPTQDLSHRSQRNWNARGKEQKKLKNSFSI
jgi:hypothetical protein